MEPTGAVRVDRWLWAIRLFKSRAEATNACRAGHVKINGHNAKPASTVDVGDRIEARVHSRDRIVEVTRTINNRDDRHACRRTTQSGRRSGCRN
jgi:ribosome-associated heat shock protein Hsp15